MNEQQNPDGSWSKAEPEKASWEKKNDKDILLIIALIGISLMLVSKLMRVLDMLGII